MRLGFLHWVADSPSGGNRYDAELLAGLRRLGVRVDAHTLRGPLTDRPGRSQELSTALRGERTWLIDGILAVQAPEAIEEAAAAGRDVMILVHHFGADDPTLSAAERIDWADREARALRAASAVLCTSHWAAAELDRRYGLTGARVATPGVDPAAMASGSRSTGAPRIVSVAALTTGKDPAGLVAALGELTKLAWTARLIGSDTVDPDYTKQLQTRIRELGLTDRIEITGAMSRDELEAEWSAADLLVHPSRTETYAMVVTEALAHAIPAVVSAGTGAAEALGAGRLAGEPEAGGAVPSGDRVRLTAALRGWLTDDETAARWRAAAAAQRSRLPGWEQTAHAARDAVVDMIES